jgi:hypothetical protein
MLSVPDRDLLERSAEGRGLWCDGERLGTATQTENEGSPERAQHNKTTHTPKREMQKGRKKSSFLLCTRVTVHYDVDCTVYCTLPYVL